MDEGQRPKPHGNPHPKRGSIIKTIITDLTGGGDAKKSPDTPTTSGGGGKDGTSNGGGS